MAELRYQIRRFLRFSETQRANRHRAQQHQLLLAIRGLPEGLKPTIGVCRTDAAPASQHRGIDRPSGRARLLCRCAAPTTRQVLVKLTRDGEQFSRHLFAPSGRIAIHRSEVCKNSAKPDRECRSYRNGNDVQANPARPKQERTETMADRMNPPRIITRRQGREASKLYKFYLTGEEILGPPG